MGINKFAGINLDNPEDISIIESQWNANCSLSRGQLKFQDYSVDKKPSVTKIYDKNYYNYNGTTTELYDYTSKGKIVKDDGLRVYEAVIPKPTVCLMFDYTNDPNNTQHYKKILDAIKNEYDFDDELYSAISTNLPKCQMVAECEIAFSFSSPYGESALTKFKISNYIPYFFAQVEKFEDSVVDIKYLNIYVKYGFMTEFSLVDRFDLSYEFTSYKLSLSDPLGRLDGYIPDFPLLADAQWNSASYMYFSGFFGYSDDTQPSLRWFIPSKMTSNKPLVDTEYQTYIASEDEWKVADKYEALSNFYNSSSSISTDEYSDSDAMGFTRSYSKVEIINDGPEDTGDLSYIQSTYENNMIKQSESITKNDSIFESDNIGADYYCSGSDFLSVISNQIALKGTSADEDMIAPNPNMINIQFPKSNVGEQSIAKTTVVSSEKRLEEIVCDVMIHKYIELDGARYLVQTYNYTMTGQAFEIGIKDIAIDNKFNGNGVGDSYVWQVWIKNKTLDGQWLLVQHFSLDDLFKYARGSSYNKRVISDVGYDFAAGVQYPISGDYQLGTAVNVSGHTNITFLSNEEFELSGGNVVDSNQDVTNSWIKTYGRIMQSEFFGYIPVGIEGIYNLYLMGTVNSGGTTRNNLGGFANVAELYKGGGNRFGIYIFVNPGVVIDKNLYSDTATDIEDTIDSVEYNYNELYELVKQGITQWFPINTGNDFNSVKQLQTVSKHSEYMERLFKSINEESGTSLLYYSEQSYPECFNPTSVFKFNEYITHLENYRDKLYIFTNSEIKVLSGSNALTFILDKFFTNGAYEYTVCQTDDIMLFTNSRGIYAVDGGYPRLMSGKISKLFDMGLIEAEYAEILDTDNGQYYVLTLKTAISPLEVDAMTENELANIVGAMTSLNNGMDSVMNPLADTNEIEALLSAKMIAVSLRDFSIWFGSDDADKFMWKSVEIVQESFFAPKSIRRMALDFTGRVKSLFTKNRKEVVTVKELPLTSAPSSLGASKSAAIKTHKDMPAEWVVNGERAYCYSISFVSVDKNSFLYKWELTEKGQ